jgi:acetyl-CoA carboxylase carboxyl transferase subunit beta
MPRPYITLPTGFRSSEGGEIWLRCPACGEDSSFTELTAGAMVCGWCDFHFPLEAGPRLDLLVDEGSFQPLENEPAGTRATSGASPVLLGRATLLGRPLAVAASDLAIGWAAADIQGLTALAEVAQHQHRALLWVVTAAQGAASTAYWPGLQTALNRLVEAGPPWITLLAGPCYGPAAALALQADLVLAEPGAALAAVLPVVLRQAGRLPIESTRPPSALVRAGWADAVLPRQEQRTALAELLDLLGSGGEYPPAPAARVPLPEPFAHLFSSFREVHGDRQSEDDPALVVGLARLQADGTPVVAIATVCGESWADARRRHAGAIGAAGWRKATRVLRLAGRFGLPVVLLVDRPTLRTDRQDRPAEVAAALGETAQTLLTLPVPTLAVRLTAEESLPSLTLAVADSVLAPDEIAPQLRQRGAVVDVTFAEQTLAAVLAQHVHELNQTYTQHGALGRRALWQRRYVRWGRG